MSPSSSSSSAAAESPRRRLRRQLTRQVLAAVADAVAGRVPTGEAAALIVANAEVYAVLLSELEGHPGVAGTSLDRGSAP